MQITFRQLKFKGKNKELGLFKKAAEKINRMNVDHLYALFKFWIYEIQWNSLRNKFPSKRFNVASNWNVPPLFNRLQSMNVGVDRFQIVGEFMNKN